MTEEKWGDIKIKRYKPLGGDRSYHTQVVWDSRVILNFHTSKRLDKDAVLKEVSSFYNTDSFLKSDQRLMKYLLYCHMAHKQPLVKDFMMEVLK